MENSTKISDKRPVRDTLYGSANEDRSGFAGKYAVPTSKNGLFVPKVGTDTCLEREISMQHYRGKIKKPVAELSEAGERARPWAAIFCG